MRAGIVKEKQGECPLPPSFLIILYGKKKPSYCPKAKGIFSYSGRPKMHIGQIEDSREYRNAQYGIIGREMSTGHYKQVPNSYKSQKAVKYIACIVGQSHNLARDVVKP